MQHDEQEPQESERLQQTDEQLGRQGEPQPVPAPAQEEQQPGTDTQKAEEYLDLLKRTQADFINYRRRMSQEQAEGRIAAQSELLSQLFPVLDDLERALATAPPELSKHPWVQGLFLIERRLTTLLDQLGIQRIGTTGERFDPYIHEAITTEMRADVPEGTVVHVAQPGYVRGERVIRPAQVSVARATSASDDSTPGDSGTIEGEYREI